MPQLELKSSVIFLAIKHYQWTKNMVKLIITIVDARQKWTVMTVHIHTRYPVKKGSPRTAHGGRMDN